MVKKKCGIIERVNYNLPKSENSRQPKCPPEKEKAIREALKHFRMIWRKIHHIVMNSKSATDVALFSRIEVYE